MRNTTASQGFTRFIVVSLITFWAAPAHAQSTRGGGCLYAMDFDPSGTFLSSIYTLNPTTGAPISAGLVSPNVGNTIGLELSAGVFYTVTTCSNSVATPNALYRINENTGASSLVGPLGINSCAEGDLAFDGSGTLYCVTGIPNKLYTINTISGAASLVGTIPPAGPPFRDISYLAFDNAGRLWAIDDGLPLSGTNRELLQLNAANASIIGTPIILPPAIGIYGGMDLDPSTGLLHYADSVTFGAGMLNSIGFTGTITPIGPHLIPPGVSGLVYCGRDPCRVDLNGDGTVDVGDLLAYLTLWFAGNPAADLNGDAVVDSSDLLLFLALWFAGC